MAKNNLNRKSPSIKSIFLHTCNKFNFIWEEKLDRVCLYFSIMSWFQLAIKLFIVFLSDLCPLNFKMGLNNAKCWIFFFENWLIRQICHVVKDGFKSIDYYNDHCVENLEVFSKNKLIYIVRQIICHKIIYLLPIET